MERLERSGNAVEEDLPARASCRGRGFASWGMYRRAQIRTRDCTGYREVGCDCTVAPKCTERRNSKRSMVERFSRRSIGRARKRGPHREPNLADRDGQL